MLKAHYHMYGCCLQSLQLIRSVVESAELSCFFLVSHQSVRYFLITEHYPEGVNLVLNR